MVSVTVILALVGIVMGAATLGAGGWLAGGMIGFLAGQVLHLSNRIQALRRDLNKLQESQLTSSASQSQAAVPTSEAKAVPAAQTPPVAQTTVQPSPPVSPPTSPPILPPVAADAGKPSMPPASATIPAAGTINPRPQVSVPRPVPRPSQPNAIDKVFEAVVGFFTRGNPIVRVGMVVMFFGLSFLVKYAASEGYFPLELRLAAVALVAMALLVLGWKTRHREGGYGQVLQGGGIAALYLTVFAALKLYQLLPTGLALAIMLLVVVLGVMLAVLQNTQVLALMASAGGFLAPILTSDGSGSHVALFSFYLLLNLGILAVAWFKTWQLLNWVGFVFTFVITALWGVLRYQPELYASTQPFLIAFYALYLLVAVLFSLKQPPRLTGLVDGSLVFGLPIIAFGLQVALLKHTEYGLSISAVVLALVYLSLARFLWGRYRNDQRMLIESFIALGVGFATLAIPLALDARWTSATWALEAAGLVWVGLRQQRFLPRLAGYLLHVAAAFSLFVQWVETGLNSGPWPLVSGDFISLLILSLTAFAMAWLLVRHADVVQSPARFMEPLCRFTGWFWWLVAGYVELDWHLRGDYLFGGYALFLSLTALALAWLSGRLAWSVLLRTGFWLLPVMAFWLLRCLGEALLIGYGFHPLGGIGWLGILVFAAANYWLLWRLRDHPQSSVNHIWHVASAWFLIGLLLLEILWWQGRLRGFWQSLGSDWQLAGNQLLWFAGCAVPLILLMAVLEKPRWPMTQFRTTYRLAVPAPVLFGLLLWFIHTCAIPNPGSLYLPVFNPLDLAQLGAIVLLGYAMVRNLCELGGLHQSLRVGLLGAAVFVWLNVVVLRAVHHYAEVPYQLLPLWHSEIVQMALSILWSLSALGIMHLSRRLQDRQLWILGAGLLALVVLKLFTRDLSGTGTLARIVSFLVVGGLMLLIGYLSPIPKARATLEPDVGDEQNNRNSSEESRS